MPADTPPASYPAPPADPDIDLQQHKANQNKGDSVGSNKRWFPGSKVIRNETGSGPSLSDALTAIFM
jgi:hypothetical protein